MMRQKPGTSGPLLQCAGIGIRFVALVIDALLLGCLGFALAFTTNAPLLPHPSLAVSVPLLISNPATFGIAACIFLYFTIMEATCGGTLGKLALGLRILKLDGTSISIHQSITRNLLRIVDGLCGAVLIWTSPLCQRYGDRVARTIVVQIQDGSQIH
jgi:uncharacterized RDD family membrane protein YckC